MSSNDYPLFAVVPLTLQKAIWPITRLIFRIFGRLEIKGLENLEGIDGNAIFAANHASELDPFLVPTSLPFFSRFSPLFYATREKEFYSGNGWRKHLFGGLFINSWGGYGVKVGLNDFEKSLEKHIEILESGASFCVFPEGGITKDGNLKPAKGGVAYMAERGNVPIIPVHFIGNYRTTFSDFFLRRRKIGVHFGKPIFQKELKEQVANRAELGMHVYKEEANYVMKKIAELV